MMSASPDDRVIIGLESRRIKCAEVIRSRYGHRLPTRAARLVLLRGYIGFVVSTDAERQPPASPWGCSLHGRGRLVLSFFLSRSPCVWPQSCITFPLAPFNPSKFGENNDQLTARSKARNKYG